MFTRVLWPVLLLCPFVILFLNQLFFYVYKKTARLLLKELVRVGRAVIIPICSNPITHNVNFTMLLKISQQLFPQLFNLSTKSLVLSPLKTCRRPNLESFFACNPLNSNSLQLFHFVSQNFLDFCSQITDNTYMDSKNKIRYRNLWGIKTNHQPASVCKSPPSYCSSPRRAIFMGVIFLIIKTNVN